MKTKTLWLTVLVAAGLVLAAGAAGALPTAFDTAADVAPTINYQGRLTDPSGLPLNGTFPMQFEIYDDAAAGMIQWDSGIVNVDVDNGLFNVGLDVDARDFNGQALWLHIHVDGESLSPRQALLPVPYALSLSPGAIIKGQPDPAGYVMRVEMDGNHATRTAVWGYTSTGDAVRGTSAGGYGLAGYTNDGYAVIGRDMGSSQGHGYGGYFTSDNGVGVYGHSSASSVTANAYTPGVYGHSANGVGVYGLSDSGKAGVLGQSEGYGIKGESDHSHGVRGIAYGSALDQGYGGYFTSENYRGLYASGSESYYAGVFENPSGAGSPGLHVDGNLWVTGSKTGYIVDMAINEGPEPLETGDVVIVTGFDEPVAGEIPVIKIRKATQEGSTSVVGVVDQPFTVQTDPERATSTIAKPMGATARLADDTAIEPGEYLSVATLGAFRAIKVDATYGAIHPGDLLISSPNPGFAMRIDDPRLGTVIGKALGSLDEGSGVIPVLVTLQ